MSLILRNLLFRKDNDTKSQTFITNKLAVIDHIDAAVVVPLLAVLTLDHLLPLLLFAADAHFLKVHFFLESSVSSVGSSHPFYVLEKFASVVDFFPAVLLHRLVLAALPVLLAENLMSEAVGLFGCRHRYSIAPGAFRVEERLAAVELAGHAEAERRRADAADGYRSFLS